MLIHLNDVFFHMQLFRKLINIEVSLILIKIPTVLFQPLHCEDLLLSFVPCDSEHKKTTSDLKK